MRLKGKIVVVGALALTMLGGSGAAYAASYYTPYDVIMPNLQQGRTTASQPKSSNDDAMARISFIGASYRANLRTARTSGGSQYGAERSDLGVGLYRLDTPFGRGANVGLNIHNATWTLTQVQITGDFSSR